MFPKGQTERMNGSCRLRHMVAPVSPGMSCSPTGRNPHRYVIKRIESRDVNNIQSTIVHSSQKVETIAG
jgi:hypothetical protein